jgi:hypothetical protein
VVDVAARLFIARHVMASRILLVVLDQSFDLFPHRGVKQQDLTILGCLFNESFDDGQESHVGHPVCFVDHNEINVGKVDNSLFKKVF